MSSHLPLEDLEEYHRRYHADPLRAKATRISHAWLDISDSVEDTSSEVAEAIREAVGVLDVFAIEGFASDQDVRDYAEGAMCIYEAKIPGDLQTQMKEAMQKIIPEDSASVDEAQ